MRFLIDAQLPPGLARWLTAEGYPSDHVNDLGIGPATDSRIEAEARRLGAVIWSKDVDFAERARVRPGLQVVWLRLGNTTNAALRARLAPCLETVAAALAAGETLIEIR
ncbi:MAG: DUF5615 family PIN-like protein [Alphaproteobacteria bacterium]|nr:DUF5615 family PIN-like protein [Alphaproteobacteria bacterium]